MCKEQGTLCKLSRNNNQNVLGDYNNNDNSKNILKKLNEVSTDVKALQTGQTVQTEILHTNRKAARPSTHHDHLASPSDLQGKMTNDNLASPSNLLGKMTNDRCLSPMVDSGNSHATTGDAINVPSDQHSVDLTDTQLMEYARENLNNDYPYWISER